MNAISLPSQLRQIIEDFEVSQGREKLELLLDYSEQMPPLPDWLRDSRDQMEAVPECMTPVFVKALTQNGEMTFFFDIPAESPTVRGFAAIMSQGLDGATPEEVLSIQSDFYEQMGLDKVLTHQRLNGMSAILAHMKRLAMDALDKSTS